MVEPISMLILAKLAAGFAGKAAVKLYFVGKMAGLKAFLANYVGASAANVSVGVLATGATAAYWELKVKGNTEEAAVNAAVSKGVSYDVAQGIVRWILSHS